MRNEPQDDLARARSARIHDVVARARGLPFAQRTAFVRSAAGDDPSLLAEVLALLHDAAEAPASIAPWAPTAVAPTPGTPPPPTPPAGVRATATQELLQQLAAGPAAAATRLQQQGEVGRGGMGVVLRVHDALLNRTLAMKVLRDRVPAQDTDAQRLADQLLGRFLEEAQVTSQLDHPGVVPVHDLGLDAAGKVWFTMRLVKGRTASEVFADAFAGRGGWTLTQALEVVLKVCDTMGYAHEKGVLHRDLKPSNVMVGRFGEVYVMDWGLAKVSGQPDRDEAPREAGAGIGAPPPATELGTVRQRDAGHPTDSVVVTIAGAKLGTPSYMAPEQARGERLDARADVYAVGAMLYELLAGAAPYTVRGLRKEAHRILEDVATGPPRRIEELVPGVPAELVAIVDKAMARTREQRYPSTTALAADLRAFLGSQVVQAYRTGALVELTLWIRRNRGLAASLAAAALILLTGIGITTWLANENAALAASEGQARAEAQRTVRDFHQLSGLVRLDDVLQQERDLWPPWPDRVTALDRWLRDGAGQLLAMRPQIETTVGQLRGRATPGAAGGDAWTFGSDEDGESARFLHGALTDLLQRLVRLERTVADVRQRLHWAQQVGPLGRAHPRARVTWAAARAAIAKADGVVASTLYAGRSLPLPDEHVIGLVPIGMNPVTKLWEFYDLRSAWHDAAPPEQIPIPEHRPDGSIEVTAATGIVFVLLPGGTITLGAQKDDPNGDHHDPAAEVDETPHVVTLAPFFLARHELTQEQWARLWTWDPELRTPSTYRADAAVAGEQITPAHPVEQVDWTMCTTLLTRHGMVLPTEAQWEYGTRAGTTTPWVVARDRLATVANVADGDAARKAPNWTCEPWRDGHVVHAPAGAFAANAFGLHDVHGNVWEWCRDSYAEYGNERDGDGLRGDDDSRSGDRMIRGGSFNYPATDARSAYRYHNTPSVRFSYLGLRAARSLER
jgi:formylglycine-generating enzyme required for sulfatase activity/serine/threonine protein kinase